MSTLKVDTIKDTSGVEVYTAKAWVNFDGTFGTSPFTEANGGIRAAGNVSSVTDNGTGDYTVNFTNAMSDANYAVTVSGTIDTSAAGTRNINTYDGSYARTTSTIRLSSYYVSAVDNRSVIDNANVNIAVFR